MALQLIELFVGFQGLIQSIDLYIRKMFEGIAATFGNILSGIQNAIVNIGASVAGVVAAAIGAIGDRIQALMQGVTLAVGKVAETLLAIPQDIRDFAGRVAEVVGELPANLADELGKVVPDTLLAALGFIHAHQDLIKAVLAQLLGPLVPSGVFRAIERMVGGDANMADFSITGTPPELETPVDKLFWAILAGFGMIWSLKDIPPQALGPRLLSDFNTHFQLQIPPLPAVLEADRRDLAAPADVDALRMGHGFNKDAFFWLQQTNTNDLSLAEYLDLYNRLGRPQGFLETWLKRAGLHPRNNEFATMLADQIAPPSDLIRFLVREVFTPGIAEKFGQFEDYPPAADAEFAKRGISPELGKQYWAAHWDLPSAEQGFAMLQRGIIDIDTLKLLLKANDYMPFWRDKLIDLNYHPITRVDIRRIHKTLSKDHAWLVEQYKATGYSPENAEILAQFTEKLNEEDTQEQVDSIRTPVRTAALASYVQLYRSEAETRELLHRLGYTDIQVDYYVYLADVQRINRTDNEVAAAAKTGYVNGLRDEADTSAMLAAHGFGGPAIARLLQSWSILRNTHELSVEEKAQRDLTKAEILAAYTDNVIAQTEAETLLKAAGYDAHESAVLLGIEASKIARSELAQLVAATKADYIAGKLERGAASSELDKWGVTAKRRDAYLRTWDLERSQKEAHIAVSDLKDMVQKGVITEADAREQLRIQGYGDKQVAWYLQQWGAPSPASGNGRRRVE